MSDRCSLVKSRLSPNLLKDEIHYFTTQLQEQAFTSINNWSGYIIPSTLNFNVAEPCHILLRYVTLFRLEKQSSSYDTGLTEESRPIKEILTNQIIKSYKAHQPMPNIETHLLVKVIDDKVPDHRVYYENRYFSQTPVGASYPIKLPTNIKVSDDIIELVRKIIAHPKTKSEVILGSVTCPLLGKKWSKFYEFKVDDTYYNFTELLIDEYIVLKIQPSQPFIDAMKKFLIENPDKAPIPIKIKPQLRIVDDKKNKQLKKINVGEYINCHEGQYAIKHFYIKEINSDLLKRGYYLIFGSRFGYQVIGYTKTVTYVSEMDMYRLEFFDEVINAIDIDSKFQNCLLFNVMKYAEPAIRCDLLEGSHPNQSLLIEYEPTEGCKMPSDTFRTYVKYHDTKSENIIEIQPDGSCGSIYDTHTENRTIFTSDLSKIPEKFTYMIPYVDNGRNLLVTPVKINSFEPRRIDYSPTTSKQKSINQMAREMCFHQDLFALQNCMSQTPKPTNIVTCFLDACYVRAVDIVRYFLESFRDQLSKNDIDAGYIYAQFGPHPRDDCLIELLESNGAVSRDDQNFMASVLFCSYDQSKV
jgi:hypothetical protein